MIFLVMLAGVGSGAPEAVIDQVIAVVDKAVVTESELVVEARVALVSREGKRGLKLVENELDAELLASMRDYLINQVVIARQVRRLGDVEVSEDDVDSALAKFKRVFASEDAYRAFLRKYGIAEASIKSILRRDLRNSIYVSRRMRVWTEGGTSTAESRTRAAEAMTRWVKDLRDASEIRLLGPTGELELQ